VVAPHTHRGGVNLGFGLRLRRSLVLDGMGGRHTIDPRQTLDRTTRPVCHLEGLEGGWYGYGRTLMEHAEEGVVVAVTVAEEQWH
jgi:hypothetical protein